MAIGTQEAAAINAQNNPSILSDTYAAPSTNQLQTQATPPPAAMGVPGMEQATGIATNMANQLYGSQFVPGMESQRNAMIQELMDYDSMLGDIYEGQSYFPTVEGYVDNPADRFSAIAGVSGQTAGDISRTAATIDSTERAYNMAIANVMDRFMDFYQMQAEEKRWEREMALKERQAGGSGDDMKDQMAMAVLFGMDPTTASQPGGLMTALASGQVGGPTPQSLAMASVMNPSGSSKYTSLYNVYNPSGGGMTSAMQQNVLSSQATQRQLNDLWELYKRIPSYQKGRFGQAGVGTVMGALSGENTAAQFDELRDAIATNIARNMYGEKGMVSDKDIERIAQSLPSRSESEKKAAQKFTRMNNNLALGIQDVSMMAGGGPSNIMGGMGTNPVFGGDAMSNPYTITPDVTAGSGVGEIPVERLSDGMTGWINERDFDPGMYRRL